MLCSSVSTHFQKVTLELQLCLGVDHRMFQSGVLPSCGFTGALTCLLPTCICVPCGEEDEVEDVATWLESSTSQPSRSRGTGRSLPRLLQKRVCIRRLLCAGFPVLTRVNLWSLHAPTSRSPLVSSLCAACRGPFGPSPDSTSSFLLSVETWSHSFVLPSSPHHPAMKKSMYAKILHAHRSPSSRKCIGENCSTAHDGRAH